MRRGYFVAGLGATQFALAGAANRLRALAQRPSLQSEWLILTAVDPANPYGTILPWPPSAARPARTAASEVVLQGGRLVACLAGAGARLTTWLPDCEPERSGLLAGLAELLSQQAPSGRRRALLIETIDGMPAQTSPLAPAFVAAGFVPSARGLLKRGSDHTGLRRRSAAPAPESDVLEEAHGQTTAFRNPGGRQDRARRSD